MPSDEELKEQLKKQADELIEAMLASKKPAGKQFAGSGTSGDQGGKGV